MASLFAEAFMHPTASRSSSSSVKPGPRPRLSSRPTTQRPPARRAPPSATLLPVVQTISADDYQELFAQYQAEMLPVSQLFPWLHASAEVANSPAATYFGFERGQAAQSPEYRGLTTIQAPAQDEPTRPSKPNAPLSSSFSSSSSASSSSSYGSSSDDDSDLEDSTATLPLHYPNSFLVSSFPASLIVGLVTSPSGRQEHRFASSSRKPNAPVNLRAFGDVPLKYATASDLVIYAKEGLYLPSSDPSKKVTLNPSLVNTANRAVEAIEAERVKRVKRNDVLGEYRVWVVTDPFRAFEERHPELVAIDSSGFQRNKLDMLQREREEMRVLTEATEIGAGVFLGNTQDVPLRSKTRSHGFRISKSDSSSTLSSADGIDSNPMGFSICVDTQDATRLPDLTQLREVDLALASVEEDATENVWVEDILLSNASVCSGSLKGETPTSPQKFLRCPASSVAHLHAPSSLMAPNTSNSALNAQVDNFINFAVWLREQAAPPPSHCRLPRRVLLHCSDGYTETSFLALTFVMLDQGLCLPEAYLYLQRIGRSFFVYKNDVELLLRIEKRVAAIIETYKETEAPKSTGSSGMERCDSGFVDSTAPKSPVEEKQVWGVETKDEIVVPRQRTEMRVSSPMSQPWFYSENFTGHFPSRILPYLYLGNLDHASNALMLKALGITHVISVGETALQPPRQPPFSRTVPAASRASLPTNSLWLEERLGQIKVLDIKALNDDGVDSIRECFNDALELIEDARLTGGKVLVHCRVGVSRSATVVIAYLMAYCRLDLASAYLLCRSRRLHILIQPNLPFFATLHAFEAELLRDKEERRLAAQEAGEEFEEESGDDDYGAGLKWCNRLTFPYLCSEVAALNRRFLGSPQRQSHVDQSPPSSAMSLTYPGDSSLSSGMGSHPVHTLKMQMSKKELKVLMKRLHLDVDNGTSPDDAPRARKASDPVLNVLPADGVVCGDCRTPILGGLCSCDDDHLVPKVSRSQPSAFGGLTPLGDVGPTPAYLAEAKNRGSSPPGPPLVVISIEGVLCAHLPTHLSGGHTNVLSRTYLETFMDYLLHRGSHWSVAFWTGSMKRKEALQVLRMLKLPTGSPEKDERDGVCGVWTKEDCTIGTEDGKKIAYKDLEVIWNDLNSEEGVEWDQHSTIVITDFPQYLRAQPYNMILAPSFHYRMAVAASDDQFLLMMIAVLEKLAEQSNFSYYASSPKAKWDQEDTWMGDSQEAVAYRDSLVHDAVRTCAKLRILIKFAGGN